MAEGLAALTHRTVLAGRSAAYLLARTAQVMRRVAERWRRELDALLDQQRAVATREGNSKPEQAIAIQLQRLRGEYLLGELANLGFLPGYGFPTDVVPFVTTTVEDLQRKSGDSEREDNRSRRAGYPSRHHHRHPRLRAGHRHRAGWAGLSQRRRDPELANAG